ncbi:aquaporin [Dyella mobilis]|uniref:aquaporin n=1 Tax=Dyella mobilis TaxID=1849582 RepID=UPI0024E0EA1B|nr:aquaporin [Dyella mobilis]
MSALKIKTCFFEKDPSVSLYRRAFAEVAGTLLLVFCVVSAGIAIQRVTSSHVATLAVLALVTGGALCGLVVAFGDASGGHFNPLITVLQWISGDRDIRCTMAYVIGQCAGGVVGALLANVLLAGERPATYPPTDVLHLMAAEAVTTAGLMIVIFGCMRGQRVMTGPFAVAAWLTAALLAFPACYMNPAIALSATWAAGVVALPVSRALLLILAQIAGAAGALAVISIAYPRAKPAEPDSQVAEA